MDEDVWEEINEIRSVLEEEVKIDIKELKAVCKSIQDYFKYLSDPIDHQGGISVINSDKIKIENIFQTVQDIELRGDNIGKDIKDENSITEQLNQTFDIDLINEDVKNINDDELDMIENKEYHKIYTTEYIEPNIDEYFEMDLKQEIEEYMGEEQNLTEQQQQNIANIETSVSIKSKNKNDEKKYPTEERVFCFDPKEKEEFKKKLRKEKRKSKQNNRTSSQNKKYKLDDEVSGKIEETESKTYSTMQGNQKGEQMKETSETVRYTNKIFSKSVLEECREIEHKSISISPESRDAKETSAFAKSQNFFNQSACKASKTTRKSVKKRQRCQKCNACKLPDCGRCKNCKDKAKFGGKDRLRKACVKRTCSNVGGSNRSIHVDKKETSANDNNPLSNITVETGIITKHTIKTEKCENEGEKETVFKTKRTIKREKCENEGEKETGFKTMETIKTENCGNEGEKENQRLTGANKTKTFTQMKIEFQPNMFCINKAHPKIMKTLVEKRHINNEAKILLNLTESQTRQQPLAKEETTEQKPALMANRERDGKHEKRKNEREPWTKIIQTFTGKVVDDQNTLADHPVNPLVPHLSGTPDMLAQSLREAKLAEGKYVVARSKSGVLCVLTDKNTNTKTSQSLQNYDAQNSTLAVPTGVIRKTITKHNVNIGQHGQRTSGDHPVIVPPPLPYITAHTQVLTEGSREDVASTTPGLLCVLCASVWKGGPKNAHCNCE